jgi:DNA-binding transcriptional regulator YiaG
LVHRSRHFRVFLDQPAAFRKVRVADFGGGIEWENGLDYGADTLKVMAGEQRPMSGADLAAFESELDLSTAETAALLGLAERTVRAYRKAKRLPQSVAIAMRTIRASNTVLAAHYRPVGHRARGRPRKEAAPDAA